MARDLEVLGKAGEGLARLVQGSIAPGEGWRKNDRIKRRYHHPVGVFRTGNCG